MSDGKLLAQSLDFVDVLQRATGVADQQALDSIKSFDLIDDRQTDDGHLLTVLLQGLDDVSDLGCFQIGRKHQGHALHETLAATALPRAPPWPPLASIGALDCRSGLSGAMRESADTVAFAGGTRRVGPRSKSVEIGQSKLAACRIPAEAQIMTAIRESPATSEMD